MRIGAYLNALATAFACAFRRSATPARLTSASADQSVVSTDSIPEGFEPIRVPVAGVMHQSPLWVLRSMTLDDPVWLRREANEFDANAISVETANAQRVGYIPRAISLRLAPYLDARRATLKAIVTELTRDLSGEVVGLAVSLYLPPTYAREIRGEARYWGSYCDVVEGGITYLFLDCDEAELNRVNDALRRKNLPWRRSGLSYHPAADGHQYRWYVRLDETVSPAVVNQVVEETLGPSLPHPDSVRAIDDWIAQFDAEVRDLRRRAIREDAADRIAAFEHENRALRDQVAALQARMSELERAAKLSARQRRAVQRRELGDAIKLLLPDLDFLQDSLTVVTQELQSYEPVLRELRGLSGSPSDVRGERVERAQQWKKRNFSTGHAHDGRLYFRHAGGRWSVLVSLKDSQERDIDYLRTL